LKAIYTGVASQVWARDFVLRISNLQKID